MTIREYKEASEYYEMCLKEVGKNARVFKLLMKGYSELDENIYTTYGFDLKKYANVLVKKAQQLHPNKTKEELWNHEVPTILSQLHEQMENGDVTVSFHHYY